MKVLRTLDRHLARKRWYRRLTRKLFGWKWRPTVLPPERRR